MFLRCGVLLVIQVMVTGATVSVDTAAGVEEPVGRFDLVLFRVLAALGKCLPFQDALDRFDERSQEYRSQLPTAKAAQITLLDNILDLYISGELPERVLGPILRGFRGAVLALVGDRINQIRSPADVLKELIRLVDKAAEDVYGSPPFMAPLFELQLADQLDPVIVLDVSWDDNAFPPMDMAVKAVLKQAQPLSSGPLMAVFLNPQSSSASVEGGVDTHKYLWSTPIEFSGSETEGYTYTEIAVIRNSDQDHSSRRMIPPGSLVLYMRSDYL